MMLNSHQVERELPKEFKFFFIFVINTLNFLDDLTNILKTRNDKKCFA